MSQILIAADIDMAKNIRDTIQGKYKNGWEFSFAETEEELLKKIEEQKPDILFLSLSVEEINGFACLQRIRQDNKKLHICICASFCSSDFISQVILCGVDAYLPEPIQKIPLLQAFEKMVEELEEEQVAWIARKGQENYLRQIRSVLECGFIYSVLFGVKNEKELSEYCDALGVVYRGCILNVEVKHTEKNMQEETVTEKIRERLRTIIMGYERCVVGPKIFNRIVVYMSWTKENMPDDQQKFYQGEICRKIKKDIRNSLGIETDIAIGGVYSIKDIYYSYQDALHTLCFNMENEVRKVDKNKKYLGHREYVSMVNRLLDAVKFGSNDATQIFTEIMDNMQDLTYEAKVNKIFQLIILCCHAAYLDEEYELQFLNCTEFLKEMENVENIEIWAYRKFEYILNLICENHGRRTSGTVKNAIAYMELHYTSEICLEDVARYVGVSPQHFSKIFKTETGTNYVDWISELRIKQAKQYLDAGKHTIKEVCYLVGYKDPNYFSRIFKKLVGMSPSDYMRLER